MPRAHRLLAFLPAAVLAACGADASSTRDRPSERATSPAPEPTTTPPPSRTVSLSPAPGTTNHAGPIELLISSPASVAADLPALAAKVSLLHDADRTPVPVAVVPIPLGHQGDTKLDVLPEAPLDGAAYRVRVEPLPAGYEWSRAFDAFTVEGGAVEARFVPAATRIVTLAACEGGTKTTLRVRFSEEVTAASTANLLIGYADGGSPTCTRPTGAASIEHAFTCDLALDRPLVISVPASMKTTSGATFRAAQYEVPFSLLPKDAEGCRTHFY